ncbi:hypothetical protein DKG77_11675 [Flagellimonas aquimarina]|uniref:DUF302 domain-containing protein n=1 Tax=Flagellimonas aquimarina TaxID=2201895 RepID=A0A316KXD6_9FLAO|nr:DUF302 domain-containing protein [Allomuricauda koreensis]PWL38887.1 hypothetical protein DKG77_11675 [Allomuricauda koreensis]
MKLTVEEKIFNKSFSETFDTIKSRIVNNGFLLLHVIDTKQIVSKHNIEISPLKQLLFFQPKYISQIMLENHLAINDIPLKIVVKYLEDNVTSVSYQNPAKNLLDYNLGNQIGEELMECIDTILKF